jgi:hypothetical protein
VAPTGTVASCNVGLECDAASRASFRMLDNGEWFADEECEGELRLEASVASLYVAALFGLSISGLCSTRGSTGAVQTKELTAV